MDPTSPRNSLIFWGNELRAISSELARLHPTFLGSDAPIEFVMLSGAVSRAPRRSRQSRNIPTCAALPFRRFVTGQPRAAVPSLIMPCGCLVHVLPFREARLSWWQDIALAGNPDIKRGQQEDAHD